MKASLYYVALMVFVTASCTETDEANLLVDNLTETESTQNSSNNISFNTIETLISSMKTRSRAGEEASKLSCYTTGNDTSFYVVDNPSGGWTLYSTDKRISPIVASSDQGTFKEAMKNENIKYWIDFMGQRMHQIKRLPDSQLNLTTEEIESNRVFWESLENPRSGLHINDSVPLHFFPDAWELYGHYELVYTSTKEEVYDQIPRLTRTNWNQIQYTNQAVPFKSTGDERCPAGCTAIAAGQMLYFLHYKYGVPAAAPSTAYCNSRYNEKPYDWAQGDFDETIWDHMGTNGMLTAPLIADIGRRVNMKYGDDGSGASAYDLAQFVFSPYNIACTVRSYNQSDLERNLLNGMPVILAGADMNNKNSAHTFICDRYRRTRTVYNRYYQWVYDEQPQNSDGSMVILPSVPDSLEVTYSTPKMTSVGFNWGNGVYVNMQNEWFAISGPWEMKDGDVAYDYRKNVIMLSDFAPKQ